MFGSRLGFMVVEVFPKSTFLFNLGFVFREGQVGAKSEVFECVPVENVMCNQMRARDWGMVCE